jgi:hypothetical protein
MNKEVQRNAAEVRRRYGRAAERRFWATYSLSGFSSGTPSK